jgi:beta-glucosidase
MTSALRTFPDGFLFGASTASYQIEGAVAEDGRGPSIWDTRAHTPGLIRDGETGDVTDDHYHRYADDVAAMAKLGLKAYRFSIAWPRIQPTGGGPFNEAGFAFYHRLLDELDKHGIEPLVTLYHWDLPQPLEDAGGWPNRDTAYAFEAYARRTIEEFKDRVTFWTTLNEPWCSAFLGYSQGSHAPSRTEPAASLAAAHHLNLAHGLASRAIKEVAPDATVSLVLNAHIPRPWDPSNAADVDASRRIDALANRVFIDPLAKGAYPEDLIDDTRSLTDWSFVRDGDLDIIRDTIDVIGVNYYSSHVVRHHPGAVGMPGADGHGAGAGTAFPGADMVEFVRPFGPLTTMGWNQDASAFHGHLLRIHRDLGLPIVVTENGAAFVDEVAPDGRIHDADRVRYLHDHFEAALLAIDEGADVRGYMVWSLMDNFEWSYGFTQRFGLFRVDYDTLRRTWKDSAYWYQETIRTRALTPVERAPELGPTPAESF